jgi:hypothetical protein
MVDARKNQARKPTKMKMKSENVIEHVAALNHRHFQGASGHEAKWVTAKWIQMEKTVYPLMCSVQFGCNAYPIWNYEYNSIYT